MRIVRSLMSEAKRVTLFLYLQCQLPLTFNWTYSIMVVGFGPTCLGSIPSAFSKCQGSPMAEAIGLSPIS